jgi:hypothetical protein
MSDHFKKQEEISRLVQPLIQVFMKYVETSDKSLINGFSREELERAINLYSGDQAARGRGWYQAISRRLDEIDKEEQNRRKTKDRIIDWLIGFVVGVGVLLVGELILKKLLN